MRRGNLSCVTPPTPVVGFIVVFITMQCVMLLNLRSDGLPKLLSKDLHVEYEAEINRLREEFATLRAQTITSRALIESDEVDVKEEPSPLLLAGAKEKVVYSSKSTVIPR
jgi:hypothetical protein